MVSFTLTADHFALWGRQGGWIVEPGTIELMAGSASDAIRSRAELTIEGTGRGPQSPASIPAESSDAKRAP